MCPIDLREGTRIDSKDMVMVMVMVEVMVEDARTRLR